jgi:hypothetical protein
VASLCSFGLAGLPGEKHKRLSYLLAIVGTSQTDELFPPVPDDEPSYLKLLWGAVRLAVRDRTVLLAYVAGFVARASSVAISLFIPLLVNASFVASGTCKNPDGNKEEWKDDCRKAYVIASILTGVSQLIALIFAPVFGYLGGQSKSTRKSTWPLLFAAMAGITGYSILGARHADLLSFDPVDGQVHVVWSAFVVVALLGFSQIGAIVCSLALLAKAVQLTDHSSGPAVESDLDSDDATTLAASSGEEGDDVRHDTSPLLGRRADRARSRTHLKGSMAGVYSLAGGAGILLLTKVGGKLFDTAGWGWPFYMMAGFNAALLIVGILCAGVAVRPTS